jgi:hypothetical protein
MQNPSAFLISPHSFNIIIIIVIIFIIIATFIKHLSPTTTAHPQKEMTHNNGRESLMKDFFWEAREGSE